MHAKRHLGLFSLSFETLIRFLFLFFRKGSSAESARDVWHAVQGVCCACTLPRVCLSLSLGVLLHHAHALYGCDNRPSWADAVDFRLQVLQIPQAHQLMFMPMWDPNAESLVTGMSQDDHDGGPSAGVASGVVDLDPMYQFGTVWVGFRSYLAEPIEIFPTSCFVS
jgi:hypothetical protein